MSDNGDLSEITTKATQKQLKKREVTICDRSGFACRVTLWGKSAESWEDSDHGVVAIKGARVGDFGGRTLSMGGGSTMSIDPDIPEAHTLRGWCVPFPRLALAATLMLRGTPGTTPRARTSSSPRTRWAAPRAPADR